MRKRAAKPSDKPATKATTTAAVTSATPAAEPAASLANRDAYGDIVIRTGRAKPARETELLASDDDTCAYRRVKLLATVEYRWEEWQDGDKRFPPMFRVHHVDGLVPVPRATFAELFQEAARDA